MSRDKPTAEQIEAAAWAIHKHYCTLPGSLHHARRSGSGCGASCTKGRRSRGDTDMACRAHLEQTCWACPSQWQGETVDGNRLYIRYRYGRLTVDVGGETVFALNHGDGLDGVMTTEEVQRLTPILGWGANPLLNR